MIQKKLKALFNAEQYHGWGKTKRYFEGWYFKILTADEQHIFAFIFGVAMDKMGNRQSFVHVLNGKTLETAYYKYPFDQFIPQPGKFNIWLANNFFSQHKISLDLPNIKGDLEFQNLTPWSNPWYSPNIMGPFSFLPFMQCYHGILSMNHTIKGKLEINGQLIDFTGGRGYIEKDWGRSFPSGYIWMQTNHFSEPNISLKSSVAKIPYLGVSFIGYIAGIWLYDQLLEFTIYNGTKLCQSSADEQQVNLVYENRKHRLEILAHRQAGATLAYPIADFIGSKIEETMTASIKVQLTDNISKKIILEDTGRNAGLNVAGNVSEVMIG